MATETQTMGQRENEKKPGMKLADEPERKPRKKREPAPVYIYQMEGDNPTPLQSEDGKRREFKSTADARKWLKGHAKTSDLVFEITTVHCRLTAKVEPQLKVTLG